MDDDELIKEGIAHYKKRDPSMTDEEAERLARKAVELHREEQRIAAPDDGNVFNLERRVLARQIAELDKLDAEEDEYGRQCFSFLDRALCAIGQDATISTVLRELLIVLQLKAEEQLVQDGKAVDAKELFETAAKEITVRWEFMLRIQRDMKTWEKR